MSRRETSQSWMAAGGFPAGERKDTLDRRRHWLGILWTAILRISTVFGLVVLSMLLYNVVNSAFGIIVSRDTISSDLLVLSTADHVEIAASPRNLLEAVSADAQLVAILAQGVDSPGPEGFLSLAMPLPGYEESFQLRAMAHADSPVLARIAAEDIEAALLQGGSWSETRSDLPQTAVRFALLPDEEGIMSSWLGRQDIPPLSSLGKEQLVDLLKEHVSAGLMRRLERDQPFASRGRDNVRDLIHLRVVDPQIVTSFSLRDSLLRRGHIEQVARENLSRVEFKSWLNGGFIVDAQSSRPLFTGIRMALLGSLWVIAVTILFSVPLGIGAAIYLEEYSARGWFGRIIETNINNLAGVPSIIYGMLGLVIFVRALNALTSGAIFGAAAEQEANGRTVLSAGLTLGLLILPVVIINGQEAIRAVPNSLREASYGVGATKWMTVRHHVLPAAAPGIFTGAILAVSRAVGETAPLVVIGAATFISTNPDGPFARFTVLPIQIYQWTSRPQSEFRHIAAAAILVLLALLLATNATAVLLRQRFSQQRL